MRKWGTKIKRDYAQLSFMVFMHLVRLILLVLWKYFRAIILRGTINNTDASVNGNAAASSLKLIPNTHHKPSPVK